jgi:hypothetical protein
MFKKIALATVAAATALTMAPTAADAQGYGYSNGYNRSYSGHNRGYSNYNRGYNGYNNQSYGNGYYNQGYAYQNSRSNRYYGYGRRCSGTTGTIVGGVAGALLGRGITRNGYHSGTTGTILGGALGALAGRAVDKDSCRNR